MELIKRLEITGHSGAVYTVDGFGDFIFTGSGDCFAAKWNLNTGLQEKFTLRAEKSIYKIRLIHQHTQLVIGTSSGSLHILDPEQKKELRHFVQHKQAIFEILEDPEQKRVYTSDADGNLAIWNSKNWDLLLFLPLEVGKIRCLQLSPQGDQLLAACQTGEIKVFDTQTFNEIFSFFAHENGANHLKFIPGKEDTILSAGKDGFIRAWKNHEKILELPAHNFGIYQLEFFNEGKQFVSISRDKSIKLWDSATFSVIRKIERKHGGHSHSVNALYKKSEREFVTVGDDKRIIYWELSE